jgi:hypothetical protein
MLHFENEQRWTAKSYEVYLLYLNVSFIDTAFDLGTFGKGDEIHFEN